MLLMKWITINLIVNVAVFEVELLIIIFYRWNIALSMVILRWDIAVSIMLSDWSVIVPRKTIALLVLGNRLVGIVIVLHRAVVVVNVGLDVRFDVWLNVGFDVGFDVRFDIGFDVWLDVGFDVGLNVWLDVRFDVGLRWYVAVMMLWLIWIVVVWISWFLITLFFRRMLFFVLLFATMFFIRVEI